MKITAAVGVYVAGMDAVSTYVDKRTPEQRRAAVEREYALRRRLLDGCRGVVRLLGPVEARRRRW